MGELFMARLPARRLRILRRLRSEDWLYDMRILHASESYIQPAKLVGQPLVVNAQVMKNGGGQVA